MTEIKETKVKLKIEEGETLTSKTSETINGYLESITYRVIKGPVNFGIYLEKYNHIIICELLDIFGSKQLALRTDTHAESGEHGKPHVSPGEAGDLLRSAVRTR